MKNYIIHNLVYTFHRLGFYYLSVKFYLKDNLKNKNIFSKIGILFKAIFRQAKIFNYKNGYYEYLEIPITTKCTLKCIGCSNLIPCYKNKNSINDYKLLRSIDKFLEIINNIVYIRILGGEPFVSKDIIPVLTKLLKSNKLQRIELVTNGTVIPNNKELLEILKNERINVSISKYPYSKIEELTKVLKENNISYKIDDIKFWLSYGRIYKRNRTYKELKKQYKKCNHVCKSMVNGEIHLCPRSSHGKDLGIIPVLENEYLNILDNSLSIKEKKEKFNKLLKKKCITACDYCDFATKDCKKIEVAKQLK